MISNLFRSVLLHQFSLSVIYSRHLAPETSRVWTKSSRLVLCMLHALRVYAMLCSLQHCLFKHKLDDELVCVQNRRRCRVQAYASAACGMEQLTLQSSQIIHLAVRLTLGPHP